MDAMRMMTIAALLLTACATTDSSTLPRTAPWRAEPIKRVAVPNVYVEQWTKAENRDTCALLAFRTLGKEGVSAQSRAATFSGGWAVAYDFPHLRSAFGIAGAGVKADDPAYDQWPYVHEWGDGSKVEYGPEGGEGPNQLAYLRIEGQDCLYNVWSRLSKEHLEELIRELRFVE